MLLFIILCVSAIVFTACAHIPYDELDIKIFDSRNDSLAAALIRNLDEVEDILTSSDSENTVALKSVIDTDVAKVVSSAQSSLSEGPWKDILLRTIDNHYHRGIMESKIQEIKACIATIEQKIGILTDQNNFSAQDKSAIAHIIENEISKMINFFAPSDSIFRKYARFAYLPLSVIATIVTVFEPLMEDLDLELTRKTFNPCKLTDILQEYRFATALARLNAIQLKYYDGLHYHDIDKSPLVSDVMSHPYNTGGYHYYDEGMENSNGLQRGTCQSASDLQVCLEDTVGNQEYHIDTFSRWSEYTYLGAVRYMEEVRFRVENAYDKLISLVSRVCPDERRNQRIPTGEGWLTVFVPCAVARTKWQSNKRCDGGFLRFKSEECEGYIKISIDGVKKFESAVKKGLKKHHKEKFFMGLSMDEICFAQAFTLNKFPKTASIELELWDEDERTDDMLLQKQTTIENLSNDEIITDGKNSMHIISFWKNAYNDD